MTKKQKKILKTIIVILVLCLLAVFTTYQITQNNNQFSGNDVREEDISPGKILIEKQQTPITRSEPSALSE